MLFGTKIRENPYICRIIPNKSMDEKKFIEIKGAKVNNLKNIDVRIP